MASLLRSICLTLCLCVAAPSRADDWAGPQVREAFSASRAWSGARTLEVLHRGWHIEGQAVRPDHRMVAHTGFLTSARLLGPVPGGLKASRIR